MKKINESHIHEDVTIDQMCELLLVWFNALRRLGFTPDEIHVSPKVFDPKTQKLCWGLALRVVGHHEWNLSVGTVTASDTTFLTHWMRFAEDMPNFPEERLKQLWKEFMPKELFTELIFYLHKKNMPLRALEGVPNIEEAFHFLNQKKD